MLVTRETNGKTTGCSRSNKARSLLHQGPQRQSDTARGQHNTVKAGAGLINCTAVSLLSTSCCETHLQQTRLMVPCTALLPGRISLYITVFIFRGRCCKLERGMSKKASRSVARTDTLSLYRRLHFFPAPGYIARPR